MTPRALPAARAALLLAAGAARAEDEVALYAGFAFAGPSDLRIEGAGDRCGVIGEYKPDRSWLREYLMGGRTARLAVNVHPVAGGVTLGF